MTIDVWFVPPERAVRKKDEEYRSYMPPEKPPAEKFFCSDGAGVGEAAIEDDIRRKDYEAARQFAHHAHALRQMCRDYWNIAAMIEKGSKGSSWLPDERFAAIEALNSLCENLDDLADLKIKKLPHQDVVFMPQPKPYGDV